MLRWHLIVLNKDDIRRQEIEAAPEGLPIDLLFMDCDGIIFDSNNLKTGFIVHAFVFPSASLTPSPTLINIAKLLSSQVSAV